MSRRARTGAVLGALALVVLPAGAAHAQVAAPDVVSVTMTWDGADATRDVDVSLFETSPVIVPGDSGARTLRVYNAGPTTGTLTASIIDTTLQSPDHPDNPYDHLLINGLPASQLAAQATALHEATVPRFGSVDLPFTYELPLTATGNTADHSVQFRVHLHKTGTLPAADPGGDGVRAETGGAALTRQWWPFAVAGAAVATAVVAARALRQREQGS